MKIKQPVSVAGIEFDALIESTETYSSSVPTYPVDEGYSVSDNMALDSTELSMTLYVTATPVTWRDTHGSGEARLQLICDDLISLYESREMFDVVTPDRVFDNMVISSLEITRNPDSGMAIEIPITFTQVTVTAAAVTLIPSSYGRSGQTMQTTGSAKGKNSSASDIITAGGFNTMYHKSA